MDIMALPKVALERPSLSDSVYETLLEAILGGRLAKGAELNAVALAQQLQVSRTPVQEAIRRLESEGFVVTPLGRKARLAEFTADDIREVYEMRKLLESAAAGLAAARIDDESLAELRRLADELVATEAAVDWPVRAIEYDIRFHAVVAGASGNGRLRGDIGRYGLLAHGLCRMTATMANLQQAFAEHLRILAALEARDSKGAQRAMLAHIEARMKTVLSELT